MKIEPTYNLGGAFAGYNPSTNEIHYDKRLDNYPALKEKIIAHEIKHSENPDNPFHHIWLDIQDVTLFARYDFYKYYLEYDRPKYKFKQFWCMIIYQLYGLIHFIFTMPFMLIAQFGWPIVELFKRNKK